MGRMTRRAAFDFHRRVLKYKGPALFHVALRAGFPTTLAQVRPVGSPMWIVAVRALHGALWHAVMRGQGKLGLDVAMASETQFRLWFDELAVVQPTGLLGQLRHVEEIGLRYAKALRFRISSGFDQMHGVTAGAIDTMLDMRRVGEIFLIPAALMAR